LNGIKIIRILSRQLAKKIHYGLFLVKQNLRTIWVRSILGEVGENLRVLGAVTLFYPANILIGDNCTINQGVLIDAREKVRIGNNVRISSYCLIETAYLKKTKNRRGHSAKPIIIQDNVWIASGAKILAGVTIGENSIIAAGTIVTKDIPSDSLAKGIPATFTTL